MEYIKIKDILEFKKKSKIKASEGLKIGKYNFYTSSKEQKKFLDYYEYSNEALIIGTGGNANIHHSYGKFSVSTDCFVLENKGNKIFLVEYIYKYLLKNIHILENGFRGAGLKHISKEYLENIEIPIISIEKQKKLIKNLKNIDIFIDKNKQIKNELNFLNKSLFITFNKNGIEKRLDDIADISMGQSPLSQSYNIDKKGLPFYQGKTEFGDIYIKEPIIYCNSPIKIVEKNDILMSVRAPVGDVNIATQKSCIGRGLASIRAKKVDYLYLFYLLKERKIKIEKMGVGSTFKAINKNNISSLQIPIIEMSKQNRIKKYLLLIEKLSFIISSVIFKISEILKNKGVESN
ncbi:restriction endonuclease subunit S [Fusobacterium nucleatum]|uniref:restriction endonuclease subunit S n=1 Tax=Fusobacterium nucleatum TaxID=851 RepID=UPI002360EFB0|nr:restriction endonuclease subunit S [Fusobacterium nucleatum]WDA46590.1 restriction endonuclease subunit S [Fusobacterium nucleatum]